MNFKHCVVCNSFTRKLQALAASQKYRPFINYYNIQFTAVLALELHALPCLAHKLTHIPCSTDVDATHAVVGICTELAPVLL